MTTLPGVLRRPGWAVAFLAAVVVIVVGLLGAGPAAGVTPASTYYTVAYTYDAPAQLSTPTAMVTDGRGSPAGPGAVSGESVALGGIVVAAETGGTVLNFGSRAAALEGLTGDAGTAANRFFRGATSKSQNFQAQELPGGGYRLQFFSPANNPGYGKLYVQEIDQMGNLLREYKNTMGPDGLIKTNWVHGGT